MPGVGVSSIPRALASRALSGGGAIARLLSVTYSADQAGAVRPKNSPAAASRASAGRSLGPTPAPLAPLERGFALFHESAAAFDVILAVEAALDQPGAERAIVVGDLG